MDNPVGTVGEGRTRPAFNFNLWGDNDEATVMTRFKVDFLASENKFAHHTDRFFDIPNLIVRRGQEFKVRLICDNFDEGKDDIIFQFRTGPKPQMNNGTLKNVKIYSNKDLAEKEHDKFEWCGYLDKVDGGNVTVVIRPNVGCMVGPYTLRLLIFDDVGGKVNAKMQQFISEDEKIYVLFNPWHKDDQVYLADDAEKEEYVLNDFGEIFVGVAEHNKRRQWCFDPCCGASLKVATYLLQEKLGMPDSHLVCTNPTQVCRVLCALINSELIETNFSPDDKDYPEGTRKPTTWRSSKEILEKYLTTKQPVKYGTDVTFSGVFTTLCRTLGIPCRSMTSFNTAKDTDGSMTIDYHYYGDGKKEGQEAGHLNKDCIWSCHVWNDAWFLRPDLPDGYGGWQAFDSTPTKPGRVKCGPASAKAIKEGDVHLDYEALNFFSKLNGDEVLWFVYKNGDMKVIKINKDTVGKNFLTNGPGGSRLVATDIYKYPEGSADERRVVNKASKHSNHPSVTSQVYKPKETDCLFSSSQEINKASDITVKIDMENKAAKERTVNLHVSGNVRYFTGRIGEDVFTDKRKVKVAPGKKHCESVVMKALQYFTQIDEDALMEIHIFAKVEETSQSDFLKEIVLIDMPELVIETSKQNPKVGEKFTVKIKTTNTLKEALKNVYIKVDGPGFDITDSFHKNCKDVPAEGEFVEELSLTPTIPGARHITVVFKSKQVREIVGSKRIIVG